LIFDFGLSYFAGCKREVGEVGFAGDAVAEVDEVGAAFDAGDGGAVAEKSGDGEGEIAFAATHVSDLPRAVGGKRGVGGEVLEQLGEFLDLAVFGRHAFARLAAIVGDAESAEPRRVGGNKVMLRLVVRRGTGGSRIFDSAGFQAGTAVGLAFELCGGRGGEKMRVEKIGAEELVELGERVGGREIFGDVARGVAPEKREMRTRFERDGTDVEIFERGVGAAVFAEGELRECAVGEGGAKERLEASEGVGRSGSNGTERTNET